MAFKKPFAVLIVLAASASVLASPSFGPSASSSYKASKPRKDNNCGPHEFYYKDKGCCLPHGGPSIQPPSPPHGKSCPPSSHYWTEDYSCCVPYHPPPKHAPPPQCSNGHEWNRVTQCCESPPTSTNSYSTHRPSQTPSHYRHDHGGYGGNGDNDNGDHGNGNFNDGDSNDKIYSDDDGDKNNGGHAYPASTDKGNSDHYSHAVKYSNTQKGGQGYKKRSTTRLCPRYFTACPIGGLTGAEYECLDISAELHSCGGCTSSGKGQDCTAIKGAWNVGCEAGSCAVYTCALGFKVSSDNKLCEKI